MTDYTDLKARLRSSTKGLRLDSEFRLRSHEKITPFGVQDFLHIADLLADSLAAIEELEHRRAQAQPASEILKLVEEQANDDGLWFQAQTAPEAYLQQQLRLLHEMIENTSAAPAPEPVDREEIVRAIMRAASDWVKESSRGSYNYANAAGASLATENTIRRYLQLPLAPLAPAAEPVAWSDALLIVQRGFDRYREQYPKWWRAMDGTPILNDLPCVVAEVVSEELYYPPHKADPAAEHVAWCRYVNHNGRKPTEIKLCDSDSPGAFKVYAAPQPNEARELLRESMNQHIYDEGPPDLIERIRAFLKDRT